MVLRAHALGSNSGCKQRCVPSSWLEATPRHTAVPTAGAGAAAAGALGVLQRVMQRGDAAAAQCDESPSVTLADLPPKVLGERILALLGPDDHHALFSTSHALARAVLEHAPGATQLTCAVHDSADGTSQRQWTTTLQHLMGTKWQPLGPTVDLHLHVASRSDNAPLPSPDLVPPAVAQHTSHLHLARWELTAAGLAAWQLHDPARWPRLQHLTLDACACPAADAAPADGDAGNNAAPVLAPAPGLRSLAWLDVRLGDAELALALAVARGAEALHLDLDAPVTADLATLAQMQRLRAIHLDQVWSGDEYVLGALLSHPSLRHVAMHAPARLSADLSWQPCHWRTLELSHARVGALGRLPLAGLERLSVRGGLDACVDPADVQELRYHRVGLALLRHLHEDGGLRLLPATDRDALSQWRLRPDDGLFLLAAPPGGDTAAVALRLLLEAGRGVRTLWLRGGDGGNGAPSLRQLREQVAPVLDGDGEEEEGGGAAVGRVRTLCLGVRGEEAWCAGLLGAVPRSVAHVKVAVEEEEGGGEEQEGEVAAWVRALVGGWRGARRAAPLRLTLLHEGAVGAGLEAELRQLAEGSTEGGKGEGEEEEEGQRPPVLQLEVVRVHL